MRFFSCISLLVLVGLSICASTQDAVPECGLLCVQQSVLTSTCSPTNTTCICTSSALNEEITACVSLKCTVRESLTTEKYLKDTCGIKGRDRTQLVSGIGVSFGILGLLAFALRILSKVLVAGHSCGWDDFTMALTAGLALPMLILSIILSDHGLGLDIWNVSFKDIEDVLYYFFWDEMIYLSALPLTKISILIFYLRIFSARRFRICVYVLIALNTIYLITFPAVIIWRCAPINGAWKSWDGEYPSKCGSLNLQAWISAVLNIVLDLCVIILPMPELYAISLSVKKKVQVMLMFGVGLLVTVVSCLRLKALLQFANTTNVTQDYVDTGVWSTIEVPLGIVCACMPSMRLLLRHAFPSLFASSFAESSSHEMSRQVPTGLDSKMHQRNNSKSLISSTVRQSTKPRPMHQDEDSFVQLVEMDNRAYTPDSLPGSKV